MYNRSKILALAVIVMIPVAVILAPIPQAKAQFVLSSWDYPDEYGQGIQYISVYENSTGAWVLVDTIYYDDTLTFEWNASIGIYISVAAWFNSTLVGASDNVTGRNYLRHNVTVTDLSDNVVFAQANFTYSTVNTFLNPPLWRYSYYVILDFLPEYAQVYTVTVTYEVFW